MYIHFLAGTCKAAVLLFEVMFMKIYVRNSQKIESFTCLSDLLKRVVCIKFCDDITTTPTRLMETSRIYADESMQDYLPDDNLFMTYTDKQLLSMYEDEGLRPQMELLTKPELLLRLYHLCRNNLTAVQLEIIKEHISGKKISITETDVEHLLEKMHKCKNIQYSGMHPETNLFVLDQDGNIRTESCLSVINKLNISNWDDEMIGRDPEYLGDILVVFQIHDNWIDNEGERFDDLCIYIKVDLNQTTGDGILLVTMHPSTHDHYVD